MRNLLVVVILGLVAVVHSAPDNNQAETQDDVYREAETDGYLINHPFQNALTTESPEGTTTVQAPQQLFSDSKEAEGSGDSNDVTSLLFKHGGELYAHTTQSASHTRRFRHLSSDSKETEGSGDSNDVMFGLPQYGAEHYATTIQSVSHSRSFRHVSSESKETEGSGDSNDFALHEGQHYATTIQSVSHTHSIQQLSSESKDNEGSGHDNDKMFDVQHIGESSQESNDGSSDDSTSASPSMTEVSTTSSKFKAFSRSGVVPQLLPPSADKAYTSPESPNKGYNTPSWIIIVAFIVGVAALVMVCVAIATRDKWNGPSQAFQPQTKTDSSNQQMELEMETFLQRDQPRENGQANEYTVIPLEEFPEENSSY